MKELEEMEITVKKKTIKRITCNFCNKILYDRYNKELCSMSDWIAGTELKLIFGYGSKFDSLCYSGHICDICFETILKDKLQIRSV